MLNAELGDHCELDTLLDLERLVLQGSLGARLREVDDDGLAVGRLEGQRLDDADARVVGVTEVLTATSETKGLLVTLK